MSALRMRLYALAYALLCAVLPVALLTFAAAARAQGTGAAGYTLGDVVSVLIIGIGAGCAFKGYQTGRMR